MSSMIITGISPSLKFSTWKDDRHSGIKIPSRCPGDYSAWRGGNLLHRKWGSTPYAGWQSATQTSDYPFNSICTLVCDTLCSVGQVFNTRPLLCPKLNWAVIALKHCFVFFNYYFFFFYFFFFCLHHRWTFSFPPCIHILSWCFLLFFIYIQKGKLDKAKCPRISSSHFYSCKQHGCINFSDDDYSSSPPLPQTDRR